MPRNVNEKMETKKDLNNEYDENVCVVCYRTAEIFSIGECDHAVCHECSTRMRVLCGRTECPICRKDMAMVVFTRKIQQFATIHHRNMKCERRYCIYFEDDDIMNVYDTLLLHSCTLCTSHQIFKNFITLKDHMRKRHELFYCDLCVENLKIFTQERRCYTRALLAHHRRIGDKDDKSHRGHPLCEFCDTRFMDNDELFRHLRRDHFFCHFCDADGNHHYYEDYEALRNHFRKDHFLCEEGNCMEERFVSAFRTKLDLQAHSAQNHSYGLNKSEARQARTVDIAFTVNHRQGHFNERGRDFNERGRDFNERGRGGAGAGARKGEGRGRRPNKDFEEQAAAAAAFPPSQMMQQQQPIDINCVQDFPSLNNMGVAMTENDSLGNNSIAQKLSQQNRFTIRTSRGHPLSKEEFPCLGSTTNVSVSSAPSSNISNSAGSPTTSLQFSVNTKQSNQFQNPPINKGANVSIHYSTNPTFSSSQVEPSHPVVGRAMAKPRIGSVSHSRNITVKTLPDTGTRPKSALMEEDFPSLQPMSKSFNGGGVAPAATTASWVPSHVNTSVITAVPRGPKKTMNNVNLDAKVTNNKNKNLFESTDFPSLGPSSENLQMKLNYSGRSSLTIPMKKALPNNENNVNEENLGAGKLKKKKKGLAKGEFENNKNVHSFSNAPKSGRKKPFAVSNFIDDSDSDGPVEDFSKGREGDYETVAPVMNANIKFISSDHSNANDQKKSELQIGTLKAPDFNSEDFPSLKPVKFSNKGTKKQPKDSSVPSQNGSAKTWNQASQLSKKRPAVPPGFPKKSQPEAVPPDFANTDMTFTSSMGQKFAISPTSETPPKFDSSPLKPPPNLIKDKKKRSKPAYILPPNFEQRNKALIDVICCVCQGNSEKFGKFKQLAGDFRSGQVKGQHYYEKCKQIMGKFAFLNILPELLALLPDIEKQQAVLEAYQKVDGGQGCQVSFAVCADCQQVLLSDDLSVHMTSHELSGPPSLDEFPSLKTPSIGSAYQRRK